MSDPIPPWPTVRRGDQGHPVITLQELLRAHGQHIVADGVFGPFTEQSVRGFQQALSIAVDGVVGPITWRATSAGCSRCRPPALTNRKGLNAWQNRC